MYLVRFPLTGWVAETALSNVINSPTSRVRLVIENFGYPPFAALGINALCNTVIRICTILGRDQPHQKRLPVAILFSDNIAELSTFAHALPCIQG